MMRWLWILSLLVCLGSARADTLSWEDIPPSPSAQPLVDTTGTLRPVTYGEVSRLAAGVSESGQGRLVIVVIPRSSDDLYYLASELYDSWHVASGKDDGAVLVLELENLAAGVSPGWNLGTSQDFDALRTSVQRAIWGKKEPDAIVLAAAQVMAEWMKQAPTRTGRDRPRAQAPFENFLYPHAAVADQDRLLNPALTRKLRQWRRSGSSITFVVYDQSKHPVEARAAAEHLHSTWGMPGWLVVLSARPAGAWLIPSQDFGDKGGYRAGLPKAVAAWTRAMERLDPTANPSSSAEAWDEALQQLTALTSYQEPPPPQGVPQARQSQRPWRADLAAFLLSVGLFVVARSWIWRLDEGGGPHSFGAFVVCGLLYTVVYGCALGWVFEQSLLLGVFSAFFSFPLVFGGVRQLCGYFGFNTTYNLASACALAALGLFFSLVLFSAGFAQVGPVVRTVEPRELPGAFGGAFHVRGAALRKDFSANADVSREGSSVDSAKLAPLVPQGWTPAQPVPAWLLCRHHRSYEEECNWDGLVDDVVAPSSLGIANTLQLVEKAELVTGLRSAPGARLLSRSDNAAGAVFRAVGLGLLLPLFFMVAFVVLAFLGRGWDEAAAVEKPSQGSSTGHWK